MSPTARLMRLPLPSSKRVQGDQPQVGQAPLMMASPAGATSGKPVKKKAWVCAGRVAAGGLQVHLLPPRGRTPGSHGAAGIGAPRGHGDARAPAVAGGEQGGVPTKQALGVRGWSSCVWRPAPRPPAVHMPVAGCPGRLCRGPACGPRRKRTASRSSRSPSMALVVMTSCVSTCRVAWSRCASPKVGHAPGQVALCAVHFSQGRPRLPRQNATAASRGRCHR